MLHKSRELRIYCTNTLIVVPSITSCSVHSSLIFLSFWTVIEFDSRLAVWCKFGATRIRVPRSPLSMRFFCGDFSSNLVVASLMRASESFVYKDSGVFVLPEKVCKIYAGKRDANRLRKEHRKKEI